MALRLWGSNASRANRVHWMLHELGLPYEKRLIGPRTGETQTPEFLKVNPAGKIPVLEDGEAWRLNGTWSGEATARLVPASDGGG